MTVQVTNQSELAMQEVAARPLQTTDIVKVPGIEKLHLKPKDEIAAVLVNILKSRANITAFKYVVGSHFEITCDVDPQGLRA